MGLSSLLLSLLEGSNIVTLSIALLIIYNLGLTIYRLFFSPIAHIPGPKIAAITGWNEVYWDVIKGGQFIFQIEKWHQQYGPVVRITPWEVHIYDADFYDELYSAKSKHSKMPHLAHRFNIPLSTFDVVDHFHHHRRRAAVGTFFTRQKVIDFAPYITTRVQKLVGILNTQYKNTGKVVCLNEAWGALVADALNWYTFALSYEFLDYPGFEAPFTTAIRKLAYSIPMSTHFPWVPAMFKLLPESWLGVLNKDMKAVFEFHGELRKQIRRVMSGENTQNKTVAHRTVFHELLSSEISRTGELSEDLLHNEAASITAAGIDTTKTALSVASFWILENREIWAKLKKELDDAIPDPEMMPSLTELEKLPYLSAIVQESLRLSYGVTERLTRTSSSPIPLPFPTTTGKTYIIPPKTPFSMTNYLQLRAPSVFSDPDIFCPERWLNNPVSSTGHPLSRYLVVFGKGPRMCLGMNFAQAEMYLALAGVFRNMEFELFGTDRSDVDMASTYFVPMPKDDSKGVRVLVK